MNDITLQTHFDEQTRGLTEADRREARLAYRGGSGQHDREALTLASRWHGYELAGQFPKQPINFSLELQVGPDIQAFDEELSALDPAEVSAEAAERLANIQRLHLGRAARSYAWARPQSAMGRTLIWRTLARLNLVQAHQAARNVHGEFCLAPLLTLDPVDQPPAGARGDADPAQPEPQLTPGEPGSWTQLVTELAFTSSGSTWRAAGLKNALEAQINELLEYYFSAQLSHFNQDLLLEYDWPATVRLRGEDHPFAALMVRAAGERRLTRGGLPWQPLVRRAAELAQRHGQDIDDVKVACDLLEADQSGLSRDLIPSALEWARKGRPELLYALAGHGLNPQDLAGQPLSISGGELAIVLRRMGPLSVHQWAELLRSASTDDPLWAAARELHVPWRPWAEQIRTLGCTLPE